MINTKIYEVLKRPLVWQFKCFCLFLVIVLIYAFYKDKNILDMVLSAVSGFLAYLIPELVYTYYATRRKDSQLTTALVVYDAIIALFFKYSLIILILGFLLKFTQFYKVVIIFAFCFAILSKIVLYLKSPDV